MVYQMGGGLWERAARRCRRDGSPGETSLVRLSPGRQRARGGRPARRTRRRRQDPGGRAQPGPDDELPAGPAERTGRRDEDPGPVLPARGLRRAAHRRADHAPGDRDHHGPGGAPGLRGAPPGRAVDRALPDQGPRHVRRQHRARRPGLGVVPARRAARGAGRAAGAGRPAHRPGSGVPAGVLHDRCGPGRDDHRGVVPADGRAGRADRVRAARGGLRDRRHRGAGRHRRWHGQVRRRGRGRRRGAPGQDRDRHPGRAAGRAGHLARGRGTRGGPGRSLLGQPRQRRVPQETDRHAGVAGPGAGGRGMTPPAGESAPPAARTSPSAGESAPHSTRTSTAAGRTAPPATGTASEAGTHGWDGRWVGAPITRKEDRRLLQGRGRFVGDMTRAGMLHAAFVRSPFPAARVTGIDTSAAWKAPGVAAVFTSAGLGDPFLLATLERDEFVPTRMPLLAGDQVRFAGEPVAMAIAADAYLAEDAAELVEVDWAPGPAVAGLAAARADGAPQVHPETSGNCLVDLLMFDDAKLAGVFADAAVVVGGEFTSARVAAMPLEGRACLAEWDDRDEQLVLHVSTQVPHQVRSGVAEALGLPERAVRVIAPDVGGGFGLKCVVGREEVAVAAAALRLRRPVRWTEDRQENLSASFHGHEQRYQVRAAFDGEGRMLGLGAEIDCDIGAYSAYPFTCAVEPLMAAGELPGIYKVPAYRARGRGIATHKAPTAPYRGVSRPQIVLVMERLME